MRHRAVIFIGLSLLWWGNCGKNRELFFDLDQKSAQYEFFKSFADKVPLLDPEKEILILETSEFKLTNQKILFSLYQEVFNLTLGEVDKLKQETPEKIKDFVLQAAQRLAENKLMYIAAKEAGLKINSDSVEARIKKMYADVGSEETFLKNLEKRHITLEHVRRDVGEDYLLNHYVTEKIFAPIQVADSEVMAIYSRDKYATVRHLIMLTKDRSSAEKAAIKSKMENILNQARNGADFGKLTQVYSQDPAAKKTGGLIRNIVRGDIRPELDAPTFSLAIGSISDIIETDLGYHLIQVVERQRDARPFEQVKPQIIEQLTKPLKEKALQDKINELKQTYQLKIVAIPS
ncbi:peptidylprolyl isomerase [candidate division KSB1 bacterium]|nr:peptidylprolyl isomerase [candidate division KSB1 bacterium]